MKTQLSSARADFSNHLARRERGVKNKAPPKGGQGTTAPAPSRPPSRAARQAARHSPARPGAQPELVAGGCGGSLKKSRHRPQRRDHASSTRRRASPPWLARGRGAGVRATSSAIDAVASWSSGTLFRKGKRAGKANVFFFHRQAANRLPRPPSDPLWRGGRPPRGSRLGDKMETVTKRSTGRRARCKRRGASGRQSPEPLELQK